MGHRLGPDPSRLAGHRGTNERREPGAGADATGEGDGRKESGGIAGKPDQVRAELGPDRQRTRPLRGRRHAGEQEQESQRGAGADPASSRGPGRS